MKNRRNKRPLMKQNEKSGKEKQNINRILSNNWFILKLSFTTAPLFMVFMIFEVIKQQVLIFFEHTYGIKYVLEAAEFHKPFIVVVNFLLIIFAAWAVSFLLSGIYQNRVSQKGLPKIQKRLKDMMYEKVKDLDLECYDNPEYYNEFVLSIAEADKSITRAHQVLETLFTGLTTLITSGIFFLTTDAASVIFVVISFVLTFVFSQFLNKVNYKNRLEKNPLERRRAYVHRVFYLNEYAKEIRLNPEISERLYREFDTNNQNIKQVEQAYAKKRTWLQFFTNYVTNDFITDVLYIIYLVYRAAIAHAISFSSVVVLWNSVGRLRNSLRQIARVFPQVSENSLYIEKIRGFLNYEKKITSTQALPVPKEAKTLEFKNVSFAYNEKDGNIINNVSFRIGPNEKIALVGYNGAGKTTLIKLIMRLYDPSEGAIYYNGINIKDYDVEEYRKIIGTIFQDYKIFAADVAENVVLDKLGDKVMKKQEPEIRNALMFSGFEERLEDLPKGLNTPLTTEFEKDGMDLSGGESQKIAIARAFYKEAGMIILDEPSSALDPIAEYYLNKTMLKAAAHKSVIFISHRLSTTRNADRIFMLEQGKVIEEGTHIELLKRSGKYATMWKAQAGKYVDA